MKLMYLKNDDQILTSGFLLFFFLFASFAGIVLYFVNEVNCF